MSTGPLLLFDSGAFSVWTRGEKINLQAYTQYCLDNIDNLDYVVNLDVIPGSPGYKNPSLAEREQSARRGWRNYHYMLDAGIPKDKLIHVFHQGERFYWLDRMIAAGMPYIGLSPANDRSTAEKIAWLDDCMAHVTEPGTGMPLVKFHGFAVTSVRIMLRYPWYSVDSTAWLKEAAYGKIFVPSFTSRGPNFLKSQVVFLTRKTPVVHHNSGRHLASMAPAVRERILQFIHERGFQLGSSEVVQVPTGHKLQKDQNWLDRKEGLVEVILEEGLSNKSLLRGHFNILHFVDIEKQLPPWPNPFNHKKRLMRLPI